MTGMVGEGRGGLLIFPQKSQWCCYPVLMLEQVYCFLSCFLNRLGFVNNLRNEILLSFSWISTTSVQGQEVVRAILKTHYWRVLTKPCKAYRCSTDAVKHLRLCQSGFSFEQVTSMLSNVLNVVFHKSSLVQQKPRKENSDYLKIVQGLIWLWPSENIRLSKYNYEDGNIIYYLQVKVKAHKVNTTYQVIQLLCLWLDFLWKIKWQN